MTVMKMQKELIIQFILKYVKLYFKSDSVVNQLYLYL